MAPEAVGEGRPIRQVLLLLVVLVVMLRLRPLKRVRGQSAPRHDGLELEQHGAARAVLRKHIAAALAGHTSGGLQLMRQPARPSTLERALAPRRIRGGGVAIAADQRAATPDNLLPVACGWHLQPRPLRRRGRRAA
jgi:hypothetical protein